MHLYQITIISNTTVERVWTLNQPRLAVARQCQLISNRQLAREATQSNHMQQNSPKTPKAKTDRGKNNLILNTSLDWLCHCGMTPYQYRVLSEHTRTSVQTQKNTKTQNKSSKVHKYNKSSRKKKMNKKLQNPKIHGVFILRHFSKQAQTH